MSVMSEKILATINERNITESDLNNIINEFPVERQSYFKTDSGTKQLLDEVISFELIYNYAKENKMDEKDNYKNKVERFKKDTLIQTAIADLFSKISVSDEEIKEFYDNNKDLFKLKEKIEASHILVDTVEEANKVINEIKSGLTFEEAAKKYSKCPSKSAGGSLGIFGKGNMVPEFEKAVFQLEKDTVSEPVKTQFGYHIIKVKEKYPETINEFDKVKNEIKTKLVQEKQKMEYIKLTELLRSEEHTSE